METRKLLCTLLIDTSKNEINYIAHYLNIEYAMIYLDIVLLRFHQENKSLTRSFCDVVFFLD